MTRAMKDSGIEWIGQIPENWILTKIKYNNLIYTGNSISDNEKDNYQYQDNSVPYISTKDIDATTNSITYDTGMFISCMDKNFKIAPKNSSLLCIEGGSAGKKIGFTERDVCFVNKLCCFQSLKKCLSKYIYYSLQSSSFLTDFFLSMSGLIGGVSTKQIKNIFLPIPPISEQKKIADYLDKRCEKIDTAIDNQKQIIEKLKEYKQSLITETVTKGLNPNVKMKDSGIEWIGSIPEHWCLYRSKVCFKQSNKKGNSNLTLLSASQNTGIVPKNELEGVVQVKEDADLAQFKTVHKGDFVISLRSFQGGFEYSEYEGVITPAYSVFYATKSVYNYYFKLLFKCGAFISKINSLTVGIRDGKNIMFDDFANMIIPYPPLSEQKEIVEYLDTKCNQIDEAIKQKEETISKLEEYKKSLVFECVTGKKEVA